MVNKPPSSNEFYEDDVNRVKAYANKTCPYLPQSSEPRDDDPILPTSPSATIPPILNIIPNGWNNKPEALDNACFGLYPTDYGLPTPFTALLVDRRGERFLVSFGAGGFYLYNEVTQYLFRIEQPAGLERILAVLDGPRGAAGMRIRRMD